MDFFNWKFFRGARKERERALLTIIVPEVVVPVVLEMAVPRVHLGQDVCLVLQAGDQEVQLVPVQALLAGQEDVDALALGREESVLSGLPAADVKVGRNEQPGIELFDLWRNYRATLACESVGSKGFVKGIINNVYESLSDVTKRILLL